MATAAEKKAAEDNPLDWSHDRQAQALLLKISMAADTMTNPKKSSDNPHFRSKFAGLDQTMAVVEPALREVGLGHNTTFDGTAIVYRVWDIDTGRGTESRVELASVMEDLTGNVWQQIGQSFTYLRRYLAQAFWNLVPEDDDASSAPTRASSPARARKDAEKASPRGGAKSAPENPTNEALPDDDNGIL